jgi:Cu2+-exporting ATPase
LRVTVALPESAAHTACYHCGEAVPAGADFSIDINGERQPMCCPGCRAVASLIADSGLTRFYEQRTAFSEKPEGEAAVDDAGSFAIYDSAELIDQYAHQRDDGTLDLRLLVGGVSCAACTWLIETSLMRLPGVTAASLNLAQSRLDLRVDPDTIRPSAVFARVASLGYRVQPWHSSAQRDQAESEYRRDLRRLAVAGIGMMQVGMFAIALHAGDIQGIDAEYERLLRLVSLLVTGFVVWFSARGFFESAWRHLRRGALVMDLPVALAIGLAYAASAVATLRGGGDVYFDSVVMFTFLLLLARFIEKRMRYRDTLAWQDAEQALPDAVQVRVDGRWERRARKTLEPGQRLLLRAGETVPVDATVCIGRSSVREDSFSGESLPRRVGPGDTVFAGTLNENATLELVASGTYAQTRLAALQRSIERARLDKPRAARLADRLASFFIAGVLLATAVTAATWLRIDADRALWVALSVLVISCPCALSLATPASLANAASALRRRGVIVYGEHALEALATSQRVLFDKTGTLTTGRFHLDATRRLDGDVTDGELLALAAALQRHANHPIASAFTGADVDDAVLDAVRYVVGQGVEGEWRGTRLRIGSPDFCRAIAPRLPAEPGDPALWVALVAEDRPLAWFGLGDDLRPEATGLVAELRAGGIACELVTGDGSARARALGESLGFDKVFLGQSPDAKLARVAELQSQGVVVTMVGDGLNDAPVLQRADASIAVAGATDLARTQADFVLDGADLSQIIALRRTAARTQQVIKQNFAWALAYNAVGIPLAAMGWIPPWAAALGMSASSLIVVTNAARLRRAVG